MKTASELLSSNPRILPQIQARLNAEGATNLSDEELERCLAGTVLKHRLIQLAQVFRDARMLTAINEKEQ